MAPWNTIYHNCCDLPPRPARNRIVHTSPEWDHVVITQPGRSQSMIMEGYPMGGNNNAYPINSRSQSNRRTRGSNTGPSTKDSGGNGSASTDEDRPRPKGPRPHSIERPRGNIKGSYIKDGKTNKLTVTALTKPNGMVLNQDV
ncbi:hypothetical protein N7471_003211 [Penicillium samsonianum]|uniref:uncharacterized protein n=1 Tax=Penicillium samsonianum TaxID=1882272 RepID=UPI0025474F4D|nr:uncharacterized protein N7471_003211 [Penicillium samsonianum]KAJ6143758.1 hypothetical protein N7471_003211 [Penicillium samsonianum]